MHFSCESDRLGFSQIKLCESQTVFRTKNFQPLRRIAGPVSNRFRCERMLQLCQDGRRNQNSRVQPRQKVDLLDENEVVDWRSVCDDNHVESRLKAELLSPGAGGAFRGLARNRQP